jgi:hypothetical protein
MAFVSFVLEFRVVTTQECLGTVVEAMREREEDSSIAAVLEDVLQVLQDTFDSPIEVLVVRRVEQQTVEEQAR